jgi:hypothetical protein
LDMYQSQADEIGGINHLFHYIWQLAAAPVIKLLLLLLLLLLLTMRRHPGILIRMLFLVVVARPSPWPFLIHVYKECVRVGPRAVALHDQKNEVFWESAMVIGEQCRGKNKL